MAGAIGQAATRGECREVPEESWTECPNCRRNFPVTWGWEATKFAYLDDTDGEVVTDRDCLDATRVTYRHMVECPHCGARLLIQHELVPEFFAIRVVSDDND